MGSINQGWLLSSAPKFSELKTGEMVFKFGNDIIDNEISTLDADNISALITTNFDFMTNWDVYYQGNGQWSISAKPEIKQLNKKVYDLVSKIPGRTFKVSNVETTKYNQSFTLYVLK